MKTRLVRLAGPIKRAGAQLAGQLMALSPARRQRLKANARLRQRGLQLLADFSRISTRRQPRFQRVLVDGQWDNANYWLRYALLRRSLGLAQTHETGILGEHSRTRVRDAFATFRITATCDYAWTQAALQQYLPEARERLARTDTPHAIHNWTLPGNLPTAFVYDGILKRQRRGQVDLADPGLPVIVAQALFALDRAAAIIDQTRPELVVLSHVIDFTYAALAQAALTRGIPVVVLYGDFGTNRFMWLNTPDDLFGYPGRPTQVDQTGLPETLADALADTGAAALDARLGGQTADISAIYAFRRRRDHVDRTALAAHYGWDAQRPIIGIYAPNWFDYPNGSGRFPFTDFRDWMDATLQVAKATPSVSWLIKSHPCDEWYGSIRGPRVSDLVEAAECAHICLCDPAWNGRGLLQALDGVVTVHGTCGIEAAYLGTPVLTAYPGWYGAFGFAKTCTSADDYRRSLVTAWWEGHDSDAARTRAATFAGWYFGAPDWHAGWFLSDDSNQDAIWWDLEEELETHAVALAREVDEIDAWIAGGHHYFHIFKLSRAAGVVAAAPHAAAGAPLDEDPRRRQLSAQPA